jgi:hypothetical protein
VSFQAQHAFLGGFVSLSMSRRRRLAKARSVHELAVAEDQACCVHSLGQRQENDCVFSVSWYQVASEWPWLAGALKIANYENDFLIHMSFSDVVCFGKRQ